MKVVKVVHNQNIQYRTRFGRSAVLSLYVFRMGLLDLLANLALTVFEISLKLHDQSKLDGIAFEISVVSVNTNHTEL